MRATDKIAITGLGVVAPGAPSLEAFSCLLKEGRSGITFRSEAAQLGLACSVAGVPEIREDLLDQFVIPARRRTMNAVMALGTLAAAECWHDAGLDFDPEMAGPADPGTGIVFGTCVGGIDTLCETVGPLVRAAESRQIGSRRVEQTMYSGTAASVAGTLGAGGPVVALSTACATGASGLVQAARLLRSGECDRVLSGSVETSNVYVWAQFDAMRVLVRNGNDRPEAASRPMSATAAGFVPAGGAGALLLERWEDAVARGARIYCELAGFFENCGGQRSGGTMSRQSPDGMRRCINGALRTADIGPEEIDYINGHLTSTSGDLDEIKSLEAALGRTGDEFPWVNSTKSLIGHTLGAAGSIESVATTLQIHEGFLHVSANAENVHPEIAGIEPKIVKKGRAPKAPRTVLKTSFGFGDANVCLVFRKA